MQSKAKKHYYLIGILGTSMSGLALLLRGQGYKVSGSDLQLSGHSSKNITSDIDVVVATQAAFSQEAPAFVEIAEAKRRGLPVISRSQALAELASGFETIAIAGTHGKTTTATLVGRLLEELGADPMVNVGGFVKEWRGGARVGKGRYFVVEACEYEKQFLDFSPTYVILTNIEPDHFDTYPNEEALLQTFQAFVSKIPQQGLLVVAKESKRASTISKNANCKIKTYGFSEADYLVSLAKKTAAGERFYLNGEEFYTPLEGKVNVLNVSAALALLLELGFSSSRLKALLPKITNASRRLEYLGEKRGVLYFDDYGHHPTELKEAILALRRRYPQKRLLVVFEPHQGIRTKVFYKQFGESLLLADKSIVLPIYLVPGRDRETPFLLNLHQKIAKLAGSQVAKDYSQAVLILRRELKRGDILLTIGATSVYKVARELLKGEDK